MKNEEMEKQNLELHLQEVFDEAPIIKGIKSFHYIQVGESGFQGYRLTKDVKRLDLEGNPSSADMDDCADWCIVEYDGTHFPGEIIAVQEAKYEVSVMVRTGRHWKWPTKKTLFSIFKICYILVCYASKVISAML